MTDDTTIPWRVSQHAITRENLAKVIETNRATAEKLRDDITGLLLAVENVDRLQEIKEQIEIAIQKQGPGHLLTRHRHPYLHA